MGQVTRVNTTQHSQLQDLWVMNRQSCYRPPSDFNIPIMCTTVVDFRKNQNKTYISGSAGGDYNLFERCCPLDAADSEPEIRDTRGVYRLDKDCGGPAGFLHSEKVAFDWEDCLQRRVDEFFGIVGADVGEGRERNVTLGNLTSIMKERPCEYINYEALRNVPPLPGTSSSGGMSVVRQGGVLSLGKLWVVGTLMVMVWL